MALDWPGESVVAESGMASGRRGMECGGPFWFPLSLSTTVKGSLSEYGVHVDVEKLMDLVENVFWK